MITLIKVKHCPAAEEILYRLLAERLPEQSISHTRMPTREEHHAFVKDHPYRLWWIILAAGEPVGAIYVTHNNEIGIGILNAHRRHGYAALAISKVLNSGLAPKPALRGIRVAAWQAHINPLNYPSRALFESLGFRIKQITLEKE